MFSVKAVYVYLVSLNCVDGVVYLLDIVQTLGHTTWHFTDATTGQTNERINI
jgi:hypothetical protein